MPLNELQLLLDLHKDRYRQGPGGDDETEKALNLAGIDRKAPLKIADIGCGTGASTLTLARLLNTEITAVDLLPEFLEKLNTRAQQQGLADKITTLSASMEKLPFEEQQFDVIWSEGAIYNMGFERGITDWRRYLKPGGLLIVSEITWLTGNRPVELQDYWKGLYPEIDTASAKMKLLEQNGYSPIGYFPLPEHCWLDHYYNPAAATFEDFLSRNDNSEPARVLVEGEREEIVFYHQYKSYYSYGVYIARKLDQEPAAETSHLHQ